MYILRYTDGRLALRVRFPTSSTAGKAARRIARRQGCAVQGWWCDPESGTPKVQVFELPAPATPEATPCAT